MPGSLGLLFCLILGLFISFLKSRGRSQVQKEAFGGITGTVAYLSCQVRSKSRGPVRKLMHVVQWTKIPTNFLKEFYFPGLGRACQITAGIQAFHGVLISLKTQSLWSQ